MSPRTRLIALSIYAVAGALAALLLLLYAIPITVEAWKGYPWDGKVDWIAATAFMDHRNPYSPAELAKVKLDGLGHPPTTSFWWLPFAGYQLMQISPIVGLLIVFALLAMYFMLAEELRWPLPALSAMLVFALVISASWMTYHFGLVQISGFIAFLYFLSWYTLRRGHDLATGILLGCACTFKLFPGLMVLMLLLSRRWRAVAAACISYLVVAAIMTSRFGLVAWSQYAKTEKIITDYSIGNLHNASIFGVALRTMVPACKGAIVSQPVGTAASMAASAALVYIAWSISRRSLAEGRFNLPFMIFAVLSVFMNPFTFEHYFALLVFPFCVAATATYGAWRLGMPRRQLAGIIALLAAAGFCLCLRFRWKDELTWHKGHVLRHALELANWVHMPLLFAAIGLLIVWSERKGAALLPPPRTSV